MTTRQRSWLVLIGLVAAVYGRSVSAPFQFDDMHAIVHNPNLRSLDQIPRFFVDPGTFSADSTLAMYRPLLLSSFAVNHAISGAEAWSYHIANVAVHAAVAVAVFEWLLPWLGWPAALAGAALFASHPIHSEAVYYVSSRSESLAALCVLLALWLHRRGSLAGAAASFAAGLLTKSIAVVYVPIVALYDLLIRRAWQARWRWHAAYGLMALAYVAYTRDVVAKATLAAPVRSYGEQIWSQVKGLVYYLHLLSVPHGLSVDHQFQLSSSLMDPYAGAALALLLSLAALVLAGWRRRRTLAFLSLWFVGSLAPASLVPLNVIVNEHRLYLAGIAMAAGAAWMIGQLTPRMRPVIPGVIVLFALLSFQRGAVWADPAALWQDAVRKAPGMARPYVMLGHERQKAGQAADAASLFRQALQRDPGFVAGYRFLGQSLVSDQRSAEAVQVAARATQVAPDDAEPWALLADMCRVHAQTAGADSAVLWYARSAGAYEQAIERAPDVGAYHDNLGNTFQLLGQADRALVHHQRAVALTPKQAASRHNLGNALFMLQRLAEAEAAWQEAVRLDPEYEPAWRSLVALYEHQGNTDAASRARARQLMEWQR